jgi:hypothetical protein
MNEEKKYEKLIKDLKNLQQVKAHANFEADLMRRINAEKYAPEEKSFLGKIFLPSRLIPSLGLAAAAVVVFLVVNINSEEMDNPFLIEPRLREDIIEVTDLDSYEGKTVELKKEQPVEKRDNADDKKMKDKDFIKSNEDRSLVGREEVSETETIIEQPPLVSDEKLTEVKTTAPESTIADLTGEIEPTETTSEMATGMAITKEELNFRQVQLSEKEQQEVDELRMKVQSMQKLKTRENIKQQD